MLKWYALREDLNTRKIENYNVLFGWEEKIKAQNKQQNMQEVLNLFGIMGMM